MISVSKIKLWCHCRGCIGKDQQSRQRSVLNLSRVRNGIECITMTMAVENGEKGLH